MKTNQTLKILAVAVAAAIAVPLTASARNHHPKAEDVFAGVFFATVVVPLVAAAVVASSVESTPEPECEYAYPPPPPEYYAYPPPPPPPPPPHAATRPASRRSAPNERRVRTGNRGVSGVRIVVLLPVARSPEAARSCCRQADRL